MKIIMIMKDLWRNRIDLIALLCNKSDSGTQSQECIQGKERFRNPQAKKNKRTKEESRVGEMITFWHTPAFL